MANAIKKDFPIFQNNDLVYLDTAASAQKPQVVLDVVRDFFSRSYANVHRGVYRLSELATEQFEAARETVRVFLNAHEQKEVIFTQGTTGSINLVAYSWGRNNIQAGDEILLSVLEHHANFVPWQILAKEKQAKLRVVSLNKDGSFNKQAFLDSLSKKTKLVALTQLSNAVGISLPLAELVKAAKAVGAVVLVDGAQGIVHFKTDVAELAADFYAFSGHKLYGPTGIGVLWGRAEILESMPPFISGGDMIRSVSVSGTEFNDLPYKFEAGTPHIAGAIGLAAAIKYVDTLGYEQIAASEKVLINKLQKGLTQIKGLNILAPASEHHGLVVFTVDEIHPHDLAQVLSEKNIAVRAGHHCAQPLLEDLSLAATTRVSLGLYNTADDIDRLLAELECAVKFLRR